MMIIMTIMIAGWKSAAANILMTPPIIYIVWRNRQYGDRRIIALYDDKDLADTLAGKMGNCTVEAYPLNPHADTVSAGLLWYEGIAGRHGLGHAFCYGLPDDQDPAPRFGLSQDTKVSAFFWARDEADAIRQIEAIRDAAVVSGEWDKAVIDLEIADGLAMKDTRGNVIRAGSRVRFKASYDPAGKREAIVSLSSEGKLQVVVTFGTGDDALTVAPLLRDLKEVEVVPTVGQSGL